MKNKKFYIILIVLAIILFSTIAFKSTLFKTPTSTKTDVSSTVDNKNDAKNEPNEESNEVSNIYSKINIDEKYKGHELKDNSIGVPVVYYHSIQLSGTNELMLNPDTFRSHLKWLKYNNYVSLTMDELYNHLKFNTPVPKNSIVLTFDDGYIDNFNNALPILKEYGYDGTVFMISDYLGNENFLTNDLLTQCDEGNLFVESHSSTHPELATLTNQQQENELKSSKSNLEAIVKRPVEYIAYPYGSYNTETKLLSEKAGYKLGLSTDSGFATGKSPLYAVPRVYMSDFYSLDEFINRVTNPNYE